MDAAGGAGIGEEAALALLQAEREGRAAERAAAAAERTAAAAEIEALRLRVASVLAGAPTAGGGADAAGAARAAAPPPPPSGAFASFAAALAAGERLVIPTPSKAPAATSIQASLGCVDVTATPLSPALAPLAAAASLARWRGVSADDLLREETVYAAATASVPSWIEARERPAAVGSRGSESAATLFLGRARGGASAGAKPAALGVDTPWSCFPELLTRPHTSFHPAFNGEIKSASSKGDSDRPHMFDELLTYAMLGMLGSFFRDVPDGAHRFFRAPPHAFALAAFPHVGYIVAVEWVGKLLASVVSEPFFLGSAAHAAAVARLPDCDLGGAYEDLRFDGARVDAWSRDGRAAVIWRAEAPAAGGGGRFFKVVFGHGFDAAAFRRLHAAYARYAAARAAASAADAPPPASLVEAELLFGAAAVCVRMPWVAGHDGAAGDLGEGGVALAPVAAALVWLARRGLLYVDVREPNVRIDEAGAAPGVTLVDYDDMVAAEPPESADALVAALADHGAAFVAAAGTPGARPHLVAALRAAW